MTDEQIDSLAQGWAAKVTELESEVEEARGDAAFERLAAHNTVEALKAEIERLRAALTSAEEILRSYCGTFVQADLRRNILAALEPK